MNRNAEKLLSFSQIAKIFYLFTNDYVIGNKNVN